MQSFEKFIEKKRNEVFPMKLSNGITAEIVDYDTCRAFLRKNFSKVFIEKKHAGYFSIAGKSKSRINRYMNIVEDYKNIHNNNILFYNKQRKIIGWTIGETEDPATYYMRNTGIIPEYQGKGIYPEFLKQFISYIDSIGFERISSQHHGDNPRVLIPKLKAGFIIVGLENNEIFGNLIKLVCHLKKDRKKAYINKFN